MRRRRAKDKKRGWMEASMTQEGKENYHVRRNRSSRKRVKFQADCGWIPWRPTWWSSRLPWRPLLWKGESWSGTCWRSTNSRKEWGEWEGQPSTNWCGRIQRGQRWCTWIQGRSERVANPRRRRRLISLFPRSRPSSERWRSYDLYVIMLISCWASFCSLPAQCFVLRFKVGWFPPFAWIQFHVFFIEDVSWQNNHVLWSLCFSGTVAGWWSRLVANREERR